MRGAGEMTAQGYALDVEALPCQVRRAPLGPACTMLHRALPRAACCHITRASADEGFAQVLGCPETPGLDTIWPRTLASLSQVPGDIALSIDRHASPLHPALCRHGSC